MKALAINNNKDIDKDSLLAKDKWLAAEVGLAPDTAHANYHLQFSKILTPWLKLTAKKFVRFQAATRGFSTCRGYIRSLNHFDEFLQTLDTVVLSNKISRMHIVSFIGFLTRKNLKPMTRGITLMNLRTFHQVVLMEEWLDWPEKPLIYSADLPSDANIVPKYISDDVISQLKSKLHHLPQWCQHFVIVLMETGRRIGEVCMLTFDCLELDDDKDLMLRVHEAKLKRTRLLPVSGDCVDAIRAQQKLMTEKGTSTYLFPSRVQSNSPTVSARHINRVLNKLATTQNIKDNNGVIWRFSSHQFRHTIATQMINTGVPQVMVQHYLGHESPEMTARYAHIHNETMKKAFVSYQEKIVDIRGHVTSVTDDEKINAKWLKQNIMSQSLPNGLCGLPLTQKRCPHANACLTCSHFRTSKEHLEKHKSQLSTTEKIIENAEQNGWQRIVEMNKEVAGNLTSIINRLDTTDD